MTSIEFTVPGLPIAQPRQRHRIIGKFVQNYTPTKSPVNVFKSAVQLCAAEQMSGALMEGPLHLEVQMYFPRPKSKQWKKRPMPRECHTGKPDLDNVLKSLKDALKNVVWHDDAQVFHVDASKYVCDGTESPRTVVRIFAAV